MRWGGNGRLRRESGGKERRRLRRIGFVVGGGISEAGGGMGRGQR